MKNQKGITLVALIITIIVMVILAGIVIVSAVADGGIIERAQVAIKENETAQEIEQIGGALGEWQIRSAIPKNTQSFREVITNALQGQVDKVDGEANGPLIITMKTGNEYTITSSGEIVLLEKTISLSEGTLTIIRGKTKTLTVTLTGGLETENIKFSSSDNGVATVSESGEVTGVSVGEATITAECEGYSSTCKVIIREANNLDYYFFGPDLQGRIVTTIIDIDAGKFIDDPTTELDESDENIIIPLNLYQEDVVGTAIFKYQNIAYKIKANMSTGMTDADYGIVKIYDLAEEPRVGKTVKYDNKIWTILYDDSTNGLQMISNQTFLYNDDEFRLGSGDSSITDWSTVTSAEFDGTEGLSDFEKSVYSYNNAIDTLNTACKSIVATNDNITDVRCVGSNPTNKSDENTTPYESDKLKTWPIDNPIYAAGIGNGRGKSTDFNYVSDFERMSALGISVLNNDYWVASRRVTDNESFCMNFVHWGDGKVDYMGMWHVTENYAIDGGYSCALRPVVSLSSNIQLVADSTGEADFTF